MSPAPGKDHRQDAKAPSKDLSELEEHLATDIVDAAIKVHRILGPGLLEGGYETCLTYELESRGHRVSRQVPLPIRYEGITLDAGLRIDLMVDDRAILELKSVEVVLPVHHAQLLSYMKLAKVRLGSLINFKVGLMKDGITRKVLQRAPAERLGRPLP